MSASDPTPTAVTSCRTCSESRRLALGLFAIYKAGENVPASVLRSIAYDIAANCIDAETAEFQIERRTTKGMLS